jgi:acetate---CoA ligase (ADP-forming)
VAESSSTNRSAPTASSPSDRIHRLLNPTSIGIIGASDQTNWTRRLTNNLLAWDYPGRFHFVNRQRTTVLGRRCYSNIGEVPEQVDHAVIIVRAALVPAILEDCGSAGVHSATVIASGFEHQETESRELQSRVREICQRYGIEVIGPNTAGWLNALCPVTMVNIGLERRPVAGSVAFTCQSGGLTNALYLSMVAKGTHPVYAIGTGDELVTTSNDFYSYFLERPEIRVIGGALERIPDPVRFETIAAQAADMDKSIVLLKLGRSDAAKRRAVAHTGSLAGNDAIVDAFLKDIGVVRVDSLAELAETSRLLAAAKTPRGRRTVYIGGSGGAGALFADEARCKPLDMVALEPKVQSRISQLIAQPEDSVLNPIDLTIPGLPQLVSVASEIASADAADILVIEGEEPVQVRTQDGTYATQMWPSHDERVALASTASASGVLAVLLNTSGRDPSAIGVSARHPIPCLHGTDGIQALANAAWRSDFLRDRARGTHRPISGRSHIAAALGAAGVLDEYESKQILARHGIATTRESVARSRKEAAEVANSIGYPVVLKVLSRDLPHKSDVGGVKVALTSAAEVSDAYDSVLASVARCAPEATVSGVLVTEHVSDGVEFYIGTMSDPAMGSIVVVGAGGIYVEVLDDTACARTPVTAEQALRLLQQLRAYTLMVGHRGQTRLDVDALADIVARVSRLAADLGDRLTELDVNPVFVRGPGLGALVADALVVLAE